MQVHSHCQHRFSDFEKNAVMITEDGIEIHVLGTSFQKCMMCGHIDFPVDTREVIESSLNENRKDTLGSKQLYIHLVDLL